MTPTKALDLLGVGLVVAVLGNLIVRMTYGSLPGIPLLAGATLGLLGAAEAIVGTSLLARIRHRRGARPVQPLVAARAVLVAKASSLAGAVVAGWWAGLLVYVVPRSADVSAAADDTAAGVVGFVCALGLVAGALWLEHCCRTPDDPDREPA